MSTNAIPAPSTGPANPPNQNLPGEPATGVLAGLLTPVDPARATFDLNPTAPATGPAGAADPAVAHGSSDTFHGDSNSTQNDDKKGAKSAQEKSIWRAWLLAGASRWAKGGGVENKRLELKKARASAQQVKETRQVTMNRSGGLPSKGSNSPSGAASGGKNSGGKGGQKTATKAPQKTSGSTHQGPSGRSPGSGGKGPAGGRGPGGGGVPGGKSGVRDSRTSKHDGAKPSPVGAQGARKDGGAGRTGSGGKGGTGNGPAGSPSKGAVSGGSNKQPASKDGANGKPGKQPDGQSGTTSEQQKDSKAPKKVLLDKIRPGKKDAAGSNGSAGKDGASAKETGGASGKPGETGKDTKGGPVAKGGADSKTGDEPKTGKPFSTQAARETGYRDGSRAAQVFAQVKAYSDGAADGWTDQAEAAAREKERLDKAHQDRKNTRDKEQPVTTATSADYHPPQTAQPIQVAGVTADHVFLGDNAARGSLSRGEVRTLKSFERRLEDKAANMTKVAEGTRGLKVHAEQQAKNVTRLREAATAVKGGDKHVAALVKLEEAANIQVGKADEIHKRAVRAADAATTVLANVRTRYGLMYKAVVDSDLTEPAELDFYRK
ncbi:hypothetical protein [Streptomyces sp. NPDC060366]|uniref:hypothetical protein n=1 Tax=Streptomyces sp. NPDC060366 TaxID=3347105 RepID=UPI003655736F